MMMNFIVEEGMCSFSHYHHIFIENRLLALNISIQHNIEIFELEHQQVSASYSNRWCWLETTFKFIDLVWNVRFRATAAEASL